MKPMKLTIACSARGADMGRPEHTPSRLNARDGQPLRLQKLKWVDYDYDQGGAYWGRAMPGDADFGTSIYWAHADPLDEAPADGIPCDDWEDPIDLYVRGKSRADAKARLRQRFSHLRFIA